MTESQEQNNRKVGVWIIATFIVLLAMIVFFTGYYEKAVIFINPDLKNCNGECKSSCIAGEEVQNTKVKCSDNTKVCCAKNTKIPSPECNGRVKGDICGKLMMCDSDNVCVTRCEYCALNPNDEKCVISGGVTGRDVTVLDSSFSCGCSDMQCIEFENSKLGTCVKSFCPSENVLATDYMCCSNPYK